MNLKFTTLFLSILCAQNVLAAPTRRLFKEINFTNDVLLFDAPAFQDPKNPGAIKASFQALVFRRGISVTGTLLGAFELLLKGAGVDITDVEKLRERITLFGALPVPGKQLEMSISGCNQEVVAGKTDIFGLMLQTVDIGTACGGAGILQKGTLTAKVDMQDKRVNQAKIFPSGPTGFGVISDIDDTIKVSNVLDKIKLLENTFLKDPAAVDGMPALYKSLTQSLSNPPFFYISGSPMQLYPFLRGFVEDNYPAGPLLMKNLTVSPSSLEAFINPEGTLAFKVAMVARLNSFYPNKSFLMIGDSTEKDPETYGQAFRNHGAKFASCIWIRAVDGAKNDKARFDAAFQGVPANKVRVFTSPAELAGIDVAGGKC